MYVFNVALKTWRMWLVLLFTISIEREMVEQQQWPTSIWQTSGLFLHFRESSLIPAVLSFYAYF